MMLEDVRTTKIMTNYLAKKIERQEKKRKREKFEMALAGMFVMALTVTLSILLYFDPLITPFGFVIGLAMLLFSMGD